MSHPRPDDVSYLQTVQLLGGVRKVYRPHLGNVIAAGVIGFVTAVIGLSFIVYILCNHTIYTDISWMGLGAGGLFLLSGSGLVHMYHTRSAYRIVVCAYGLVEARRRSSRGWLWHEIRQIGCERTEKGNVHTIEFVDGSTLRCDWESISDLEELVALVQAEKDRRAGVPRFERESG